MEKHQIFKKTIWSIPNCQSIKRRFC